MNFIDFIKTTADDLENILVSHSQVLETLPTEDFGWSNVRYASKQFRLAHIERFFQPQFAVLHMVVWPYVNDPCPIFGFDIIASATKATGLFFDLSPTVETWGPLCDIQLQNVRQRPQWGSMFSEHWVACKPSLEEATAVSECAQQWLIKLMGVLGTRSHPAVHDIVRAQNTYSLNQRQNIHTTKVIINLLGPQRGQYFIDNILFPTI